MQVHESLWSVEEVARHLGVSMRTMYDWRARNYGPRAKKMGRYLRYVPEDVRTWVASLDEAA